MELKLIINYIHCILLEFRCTPGLYFKRGINVRFLHFNALNQLKWVVTIFLGTPVMLH